VPPACKFGDPPRSVEICSKKGENEKMQFHLKSKIERTKRMMSYLNRARPLMDLLSGKFSGSFPQKTSKRTNTFYAISSRWRTNSKKLLASIESYVTVLIRASNTERYLIKSFSFALIRYHTVQVISFIHKHILNQSLIHKIKI